MMPHLGHTELMVVVVRAAGDYAGIGKKKKSRKKGKYYNRHGDMLHDIIIGLTFAGLHAFKPHVIYVFVCSTSAVLVPSTVRSATTDSAGFQERAALWARHYINDH